jgi:hypothetical protein
MLVVRTHKREVEREGLYACVRRQEQETGMEWKKGKEVNTLEVYGEKGLGEGNQRTT